MSWVNGRCFSLVFIAHIRQSDGAIQGVEQHLLEVRTICERIGQKIGVGKLAAVSGLLHDMGKYTDGFNQYIQQAVLGGKDAPARGSVDHSTAGGRFVYRRFHTSETNGQNKVVAEWIANCVISHHQGLRDFIDPELDSPFLERMENKLLPEYEQAEANFLSHHDSETFDRLFAGAVEEFGHLHRQLRAEKFPPIAYSLVIRYIFSCLIEADRSNTRDFEEGIQWKKDMDRALFFKQSYEKLCEELGRYAQSADADHPINRLRAEMSEQCEQFADRPSGVYTLSIPTGGGKTLASLRYALKHAQQHDKDRIIYIVPYTTIIEQNAQEIRTILGEDAPILEHHSNVVEEADDGSEAYQVRNKALRLARDDWDSPLIFTTMVQFLNTFFAGGTRNVRRLHQLSRSVLIFDEIQSLPVSCISLFNEAINFLSVIGKSSIVLCTATQPALDEVRQYLRLSPDGEMVRQLATVSQQFKRVQVIDHTDAEGWSADRLADFVCEQLLALNRVLIILNTKSAVRKLYQALAERLSDDTQLLFHLSTSMCATHRKQRLKYLKEQMKAEQRVVCVSTQLIEAGVDISFSCVIRSLSGLDSIAQAAGRCNRHGKGPLRQVYVVNASDEVLTRLPEIKMAAEQTARVLREFAKTPETLGGDLLSAAAMRRYFQYYYHQLGDRVHYPLPKLGTSIFELLDRNQTLGSAYKHRHGTLPLGTRTSFATAEKHFEVIGRGGRAVIVPYDQQAEDLIADLSGERPRDIAEWDRLLRQAQAYTVQVYEHELKVLAPYLVSIAEGQGLALLKIAYSDAFGIDLQGEGEWDADMM